MTANYSFYFHREPGWHVSRGWLKSPPKNVNLIVADGRVFFFFQECRTLKDSCLYPFFVFSSLATISPSSCLLPFQSFNPLFLRPFFLFFGFPFCFPLRIFFTFPVFPLPFPLCIRPWPCPCPSNARVNIIMCMPFLCSSYIREKYVLQHPYDSTL